MDEFNGSDEYDGDFADHRFREILQEAVGEKRAPSSLDHLPKVYRLVSLSSQNGAERHVLYTASIFHEKVEFQVSWVARAPDARLKAGELVSPRWSKKASFLNGVIMIDHLVPLDRPHSKMNIFQTVPDGWVEDRGLIARAAELVDAMPMEYRHLFNAIFWDGERFHRFCTLQLYKYGHHAEVEGCLRHAVESAEFMREAGKGVLDANEAFCILLGLLHDAGKAGEYYCSREGKWEPTNRGKLLWHKAIILDWISEARARWNPMITPDHYTELLHCLVSSSHFPEWMGAKEPQMPEARLLLGMERPSGMEELLRRTAMNNKWIE